MFTFKLYSDNGDCLASFETRNQFSPVPDWFYRKAVANGIDSYQIVGPNVCRFMSF